MTTHPVGPAPKPWEAERVVDAELARAMAERHMPVRSIARLGAGWDNTAWLIDGINVLRMPRRHVAVRLLEREIAVLGALAPRLPLPVTSPLFSGHDPDGWPYAAYRYLDGEVLALRDDEPGPAIGQAIGAFVRALHACPPVAGLGGDELGKVDVARRLELTRALAARHGVTLPDDLVEMAQSVTLAGRPVVVVHGDLDARHVLVEPSPDGVLRPTGVIDWGDVHRGDPATDLAFAFSALAGEAREAFMEAYGHVWDGLPTVALARFRAVHVALAVLDWATDLADAKMAAGARAALERSVKRA